MTAQGEQIKALDAVARMIASKAKGYGPMPSSALLAVYADIVDGIERLREEHESDVRVLWEAE